MCGVLTDWYFYLARICIFRGSTESKKKVPWVMYQSILFLPFRVMLRSDGRIYYSKKLHRLQFVNSCRTHVQMRAIYVFVAHRILASLA